MKQDLRKLFEEKRENETFSMQRGHEERFMKKLDTTLHKKNTSNSFYWLKIAASIVILLSVATYFFLGSEKENLSGTTVVDKTEVEDFKSKISLGTLSPDLKKIENYYTTNINLELANLTVSDSNKDIVDNYMQELSSLDEEYKKLNIELNTVGPNDQTIEALIQNLQLRLQLLKKLKAQLNQLKLSKNEQTVIM